MLGSGGHHPRTTALLLVAKHYIQCLNLVKLYTMQTSKAKVLLLLCAAVGLALAGTGESSKRASPGALSIASPVIRGDPLECNANAMGTAVSAQEAPQAEVAGGDCIARGQAVLGNCQAERETMDRGESLLIPMKKHHRIEFSLAVRGRSHPSPQAHSCSVPADLRCRRHA